MTVKEIWRYRFDNFMSRGFSPLIYLLGVLALTFGAIMAVIFLLIFPNEKVADKGFFEVLWITLMHLLDPGQVADNIIWPVRILMLFETIIGILFLSTFIGLVSNMIMRKFEDLRRGRSKILEENHILILGWSTKIHSIISELITANENQDIPVIAILANKDKVHMENEIKERLTSKDKVKIVCRTGNPIDLNDLELGNPKNSRSIIILDTENDDSDVQVIKTILAITANPKRRAQPYHITAEIKDEKNMEVARMVGKKEAELILSDDFISKIIVQTSRQSGLSVVYTDFLDFDGDEIYFHEEKKLFNKTFREALFSYNTSCIIGFQLPDESIVINPDINTKIPENSKLIALSEDDDKVIIEENLTFNVDENILAEKTLPNNTKEKYLILGWNHRTKKVINELTKYLKKGSSISIMSEIDIPEKVINSLSQRHKEISFSFENVSTTSSEVLSHLELNSFDHILIQSYLDHYELQEADAKTLITLLHLRKVKEKLGNNLNIVTEMLDINNRELAKITNVDDFIISYNFISLIMSQVSENKHLMKVFDYLFQAEGNEVYIRPVKYYVDTPCEVNFFTLLESSIRKKEIAIGYRRMEKAYEPEENYGIVLNPVKSESISLNENDCLIVLAEN